MSAPPPLHTADQKRNIRRTVLALLGVITVIILLFLNKFLSPRVLSHEELLANNAVMFSAPRIIPPFELVDHRGQPFTLERVQGKWTLVFFGFTSCPDICPATLAILSQWYQVLDPKIREQTQVVMISVDPVRDRGETLSAYIAHFHDDFIGVTGEFVPIRTLADQLNVAFTRVALGDDDYTVDHSSHIVLINPYGHYHGIFRAPFQIGQLKLTFQSIVNSF